MLLTFTLYLFFGAIAGLVAGLLGLGGGIIIVPMLIYVFQFENMPPDSIQLLAVATSLACIMFTSLASLRAHHHRGSVDWAVWRTITPGILLGTFLGTWLAVMLPRTLLKGLYVAFLAFNALRMLFPGGHNPTRSLPSNNGIRGVGGAIGLISGMVGGGGGVLSVPFLAHCNVPFHTCIGTSAAIGFPIALSGMLGYVINGWNAPELPPYSLGYVYLPACSAIVISSTLFANLGVRLAHRLPVFKLKRIFAIFLLLVSLDMLRKLI